jgi:hypothetical protein
MLTKWHRSDIFTALNKRRWEGPFPNSVSEEERRYVGESYSFRRQDEQLKLYFVADFGDGYSGPKSIEAAIGVGFGRDELWLHRTRDSKWRRQLLFWADLLSGIPVPDIREPNTRPTLKP